MQLHAHILCKTKVLCFYRLRRPSPLVTSKLILSEAGIRRVRVKGEIAMKAFALGIAAVLATSTLGLADTVSATYDWEDGGTIVGSYGNLGSATNVYWDPTQGNVVELTEDPVSGTPQAFVAWITGLNDGDIIDASFLGFGDGEDFSKVRIWAHYTTGGIDDYGGSAGGNNTYSGEEWTLLSDQWEFSGGTDGGGDHTGLVIEARIYTYSGQLMNSAFVDDLSVSVTAEDVSGIEIHTPAIPAPGALAFLGLAGLAGRRRRC